MNFFHTFEENSMTMHLGLDLRPVLFAACMALAVLAGPVRAEEVPIVTGEQWTQSTPQVKKVYLVGMANVIQVETAYSAGNPPADAQSFVPRFARGLKGQTLDSVMAAVDGWYAKNPGRLQRPVIETIWFEMVVPGLQKNK
jgi:hypothetical protein